MSIESIERAGFVLTPGNKSGQQGFNLISNDRGISLFFLFSDPDDPKDYLEFAFYKLISIVMSGVRFSEESYTVKSLKHFIDQHYQKLPPETKLDNILRYFRSRSHFDGQTVSANIPDEDVLLGQFFVNEEEWWFYLESAVKLGFLRQEWKGEVVHPQYDDNKIYEYGLTVDGLVRLIQANEGMESLYCFVAMAFDPKMDSIYQQAIEPAIRETGYFPIRVDKLHVPSDKTINDEIIASIKKSHFIIADFTMHKDGVYFEAGYALGKGLKVIYSCQSEDLHKAHFDIRNYQHIVWTDAEDLKNKLVHKIEAFIK